MKKVIIFAVIVACLGIAGFGTWKILETQVLSSDKLSDNVKINGVDCSNMTTAEAQEKLTKIWNKKELVITQNKNEVASFSDFDFSYAIDNSLNNLKKDHFTSAVLNHFFGTTLSADIHMEVSEVSDSFKKQVKTAKAFIPEKLVKTKNASIDLTTDDFKIVPEVYGTDTDYNMLIASMVQSIENNQMELNYTPEEYYKKPEITKDSQEIQERLDFCNSYLKDKVTYQLGEETVSISPAEIDKLIDVKFPKGEGAAKSAKITVKKAAVRKYVETFSANHSTVGMKRDFKAYSGNHVVVQGGDYGYTVNIDKEVKQLTKDLKNKKKVTREPKWGKKGWGDYSQTNDIGTTYVEISIGKQHLWYYKDGKKVVDCNVVTGDTVGGTITPTGTYGLTYKERHATLKGYNTDGTTYESPVSYWMPFYGNYGMHDAPWRGKFGGSIYRGSGSHGCVNMPPSAAAKLYNNLADSGTPVIVHN